MPTPTAQTAAAASSARRCQSHLTATPRPRASRRGPAWCAGSRAGPTRSRACIFLAPFRRVPTVKRPRGSDRFGGRRRKGPRRDASLGTFRSASARSEILEKKGAPVHGRALRARAAAPRGEGRRDVRRARAFWCVNDASIFRILVHANGDRRGLHQIGGGRRRGLGQTRLWVPSDRHASSAFAAGMLGDIGGKKGACVYGATELEMEFRFEWFVPSDSYLQVTFFVCVIVPSAPSRPSPTACLLRGCGRAGTQNDLLDRGLSSGM